MTAASTSTPQREVARLRAALLGGRGPGASAEEIAHHTRDRRWVAGIPVAFQRERVARRARLARSGVMPVHAGRKITAISRAVAVGTLLGLLVVSVVRRRRAR